MRYSLLSACALTLVIVGGCAPPERKPDRPIPGTTLRQKPITDQGIEGAKSRLVTAGDIVIRYAEKHGSFPLAEDSLKLRDVLRPEFGHEPGFEELWVSHNGKALILYNQMIAGKELSKITDPDKTWLLKDPVAIPPIGRAIVYVSGRVDAIVERPVAAGGLQ